jgi:hypothetical protein
MRHARDPRQNRLFDPFQGVISPAGARIIAQGWQGVFRHAILELMPVHQLGEHFSETLGAPTKELYSMAGLVFLTDFFSWTVSEAVEAYMFRADAQYALNLEPGVEVSSRTIERYQKLFREDDLAAQIFSKVTTKLADCLDLDVSRQRLDSTHLSSHMATFARTKLMAVAIKRFLTQVKRHVPDAYAALPEELRSRYALPQSQLFAGAKDAAARKILRQQAADDLFWVIEHFAKNDEMTGRSTYKALVTIFQQQCEVKDGKVTVKAKTGGDVMQNPSDPDATYGHKGPGYQVQITETSSADNAVQLITTVLPQTACEPDSAAVRPIVDQLKTAALLPKELTADTLYGSDENVQYAEANGVDLVAPARGPQQSSDPCALTIDDFAVDERTGHVDACPAGHTPLSVERDETLGTTRVEMPASACADCPFFASCPINKTRDGHYSLEFSDRDFRLAGRRVEQETSVFADRYASRAGIESTNSGLKSRLGLGHLGVRGRGSVFRVILHKTAGWNVLRAAASQKMRAWVAVRVAQNLESARSAQIGDLFATIKRFWAAFRATSTAHRLRPKHLALVRTA